MKKLLSFFASIGLFGGSALAQCGAGEVAASVQITTDQWGYEAYWEVVPTGNSCGTGTIASGGTTAVGCSGGGAQAQGPGAGSHANNATEISSSFCLTDGAQYDLIEVDDWGDGGSTYTIITGGFPSYTSSGNGGTHTFTASALPDYDAKLVSVESDPYVATGTSIAISGEIQNLGALNITSIDVTWNDGSGAQTQTISGLNIATGETGTFTHPTQLNIANATQYSVDVTLDQANDANLTNNDASFTTLGLDNPASRTHVFEEATGTWCGWCPRGMVGLQNLEQFNDAIGIAVHNGDPMVVTEYDNGIGAYIGGYPSGLVNRMDFGGSKDVDPGQFVATYQSGLLPTISPFGIESNITNYNASAGTFDVEITVTPSTDLNGDYRVNLVLIENDVIGSGSGYDQTNYYGSNNISLPVVDVNGNTIDWKDLGGTVSMADIESNFGGHQHVARSIEGGFAGTANSLPTSMTNGSDYSYTYTGVTIDGSWNIDNMKAVAMVIDNNGSGEVLNAVESNYLWSITQIEEVANEGFTTRVYPNPNNGVFNLMITSNENENFQISVSNMVGQNVYNNRLAVNGIGTATLDLSSFDKGVYFVTVKGANTEKTTKVIVK